MRVHLILWLLESLAVLLLVVGLHLHVIALLSSRCDLQGRFSAKPKESEDKQYITKDKNIVNRRISGGMLKDKGKGDQ